MSSGHAADTLERVDHRTLVREVTITPAMCGHNALLIGQIGDWTWDAVSRLCGVNVFRAVDGAGHPTYLSFYFYRIFGDRHFHPRTPTFGDRLQVVSTCYGLGSESIVTLHRLAPADRGLPPALSAQELLAGRHPGCLYVQHVNRWIHRGARNTELYTATPLGFRQADLDTLPAELSPRLVYDVARRQGAFAPEPGLAPAGAWTIRYEVDPARDLNGVGLLYFATYFSITDSVLGTVWRRLGRSARSFLDRVVVDTRLCFLGNAEPGTVLAVRVRRSAPESDGRDERFDVQIVERASRRMLAVAAINCKETGPRARDRLAPRSTRSSSASCRA